MGAAWAALHEGHRGNEYDGPGKSEAIAKLKKLYEREGMKPPGASVGSYVCVCPPVVRGKLTFPVYRRPFGPQNRVEMAYRHCTLFGQFRSECGFRMSAFAPVHRGN